MLFRLILALLALASAAGAQPRPTQLEPITSLHWAPGTGTLTVDFRAGCMSSSYVLLGQTLRAERDGDTIALGGHFLMDMSARILQCINLCSRYTKITVMQMKPPGAMSRH